MKSKILVTGIFCLTLSLRSFSQKEDTDGSVAFWEKSISVRKAFEDKNDKDKPAVFSVTWPKNKERTFLINGGVSLSFARIGRNNKAEFDFFAVYNRNNQIDKKQNNIKAGLTMDYKIGKGDRLKNSKSYIKIFPSAQYMSNKIDTTKSFVGTLYTTWILKKPWLLLNGYKTIAKSGVHLYLGPVAGLEYQNRFDVKKPALQGAVTRVYLSGDVRLMFKVGVMDTVTKKRGKASKGDKIAEIIFNKAWRNDIKNTSATPEGWISLFKTEFAFYPLKNDVLSFGLSYSKGEDPIAGLEKQEFWQFAIKFKFDHTFKK